MNNVEIRDHISKGRGVFASKSLSSEDRILYLDQFALSAISTAQLPSFCYHCYAQSRYEAGLSTSIDLPLNANLKICTGCKVAWFCDKPCQSVAWKQYHKHECKIFAKLFPKILPESVRAVVRFALQHKHNFLPEEVWSSVLQLCPHIEKLRNKERDWMDLNLMAKGAAVYSQAADEATFLRLLCVLKINGVTLQTTFNDPIGVFLDPLIALINHSCDQNVYLHRPVRTNTVGWPQRRQNDIRLIELLPLRNIELGEELTVSYIDSQEHFSKRQAELQKSYFFSCVCTKCDHDRRMEEYWKHSNVEYYNLQMQWRGSASNYFDMLESRTLDPGVFSAVTKNLTRIAKTIEANTTFSPAIDPYPRIIQELKLLHMSGDVACDLALICAFKQHLIIDPQMYTSPIHPTRVVNAVYLLRILTLLHDTFFPDPSINPEIKRQREKIESQGFSEHSFRYWRLKITSDMRDALHRSAAKDLIDVFELGQLLNNISVTNSEDSRVRADEEIRKLLGFSKERWVDLRKSENGMKIGETTPSFSAG